MDYVVVVLEDSSFCLSKCYFWSRQLVSCINTCVLTSVFFSYFFYENLTSLMLPKQRLNHLSHG